MLKRTAPFLQAFVVLFGIAVFAFLLWEPHVEGVNANATTLREIYFDDPFLAFAYLASIAFFMGLYQIFKALGYVRRDKASSPETAKALRTLKHCAAALIGFVAVSVFFMFGGDPEDRPPGVFMRLLVLLPSTVVALSAAKLERKIRAS